ncbi:MAG: MarR family winged helix-turn-helix transcriptional regulator, partial [Bacillota bacterium]|nr:MarR family winged helix-turn-helix transcriptional regulator [Bacillota bacterium]
CCGVSMAGCHIIMEAGKAGQLTLSSLAAGLGLDLSSVSRGVDGLVRDGYLRRVRHPTDRRYILISLTPQGQQAYDRVETSGIDLAARILENIPAGSRVSVTEGIEQLNRAIEGCCPETCTDPQPLKEIETT